MIRCHFDSMLMQAMLGSYDRASEIGKNSASRLCQEMAVSETAHSLSSIKTCYSDTSLFGVYAVAPDNKLDNMMWHMMKNLVQLVHTAWGEEVERVKVHLKAAFLMTLGDRC